MSKSAKLTITPRERSSKGAVRQLRRDGFLPGSISKKGEDAISFSISRDELRRALAANGMSSVYTLTAGKKESYPVMLREIQYAPVTREWLHVTFQAVSLTEETTAEIPFNLIGRDDLVYAGFELLQQLETLLVRGLPGDFPSSIDIDVATMTPGDQVVVADLNLPEGITAQTEEDRLILSVSYPKLRVEEEEAAAEAAEGEEAADEAEAPEGEAAGE